MSAENITVLAPAFYENKFHIRYLSTSAERYAVPITYYGRCQPYKGWLDAQVTRLFYEITQTTTSHILYTDASDALFCTGLDKIWAKYEQMGCPDILFSYERSGLCAGGFIAEKGAILKAMEVISRFRPDVEDPDNPQVRWRVARSQGAIKCEVDETSEIFQIVDEDLMIAGGRIHNPRTGTNPSVIHFAGGYTHPQNGKAELIEPTWKRLGYEN